jgi:hypothetical protein
VPGEDNSICDTKLGGKFGKVLALSPITDKFNDNARVLREFRNCPEQDVNSLFVI